MNIALNKPVHSNLNNKNAYKVTDGNNDTYWEGIFFPCYVEIDLLDTYDINKIMLYFKDNMAFYYTLYGINDHRNYDRIYKNHSDTKKNDYDIITLNNCLYRYIRIYIEYNDTDEKAYLKDVKIYGIKQNNNTFKYAQNFKQITGIEDFNDTIYNTPITNEEIYNTIYGIIERTIGKQYCDYFTFEIKEDNTDYFELSDLNNKIHIKANKGLSITSGLNYYYKHYLKIQITENTRQTNIKEIVKLNTTIRKETRYKIRYALNYCTLSYSFPFVNYEQWLKENDYFALNGINCILDLAGMKAVWIKFLMNYNYPYQDAKDFIVGPAYNAWWLMDNMEVFGGPLHDDYIKDRVIMARKIQRYRRTLGIDTILQGYAGMVPTNFNDYCPDIKIIEQGTWNGFNRPAMIKTSSKYYKQMAKDFYEAQRYIFGNTSKYFAVDPFHEGGKRDTDLTDSIIAQEVLASLLAYRKDAIWVIQSWWSNPTNDLLKGMKDLKDDHALIIDLIDYPLSSHLSYQKKKYYDTTLDDIEFNNTKWVWALLANFGGNPSMNGQMEEMLKLIKKASTYPLMSGIGIISEATNDNPMIYELLFSMIYEDIDNIDKWMMEYLENRYGLINDTIVEAWQIIKNNNYNLGVRMIDQVIDIRSSNIVKHKKTANIYYQHSLYQSFKLLFSQYELLKENQCYRYDLSEIAKQIVSDHMAIIINEDHDNFISLFDLLNDVLKTNKEFLVGNWINKARKLADNYDDFTMDNFTMNAKSLITTWGSIEGSLIDYAFRLYEGSLIDIYKENYLKYDQKEEDFDLPSQYARRYFKWVLNDKEYTDQNIEDLDEYRKIMQQVLVRCYYPKDIEVVNIAENKKIIHQNNEQIIDLFGLYDIINTNQNDLMISKDNKNWYPLEKTKQARYIKAKDLTATCIYAQSSLADIDDLKLLLETIDRDKCDQKLITKANEAIIKNEAIDTINNIYWNIINAYDTKS